ncbi:MAG: hypothetical protein ACLSV7_11200, partial [Oscillospiraceae bacterium]
PPTPQTITITVSVSGAYTAKDTFVAKIVDLNEHIPPDPLATDTNPGYTVPSLPSNSQKLTANWGVWSCYWVPVWVWCDHEDGGHWVDEGYWEFEYTGYSASISGTMALNPDDIVPTAAGKSMKSGYGVKTDVTATLSTNAPTSHITYPQTAFSVFPEFQYQTYLPEQYLADAVHGLPSRNEFPPTNGRSLPRLVSGCCKLYGLHTGMDTWTPDGMLSVNLMTMYLSRVSTMTGIPIENNILTAYHMAFICIAGFAVYDICRRVPNRALVFLPFAAFSPCSASGFLHLQEPASNGSCPFCRMPYLALYWASSFRWRQPW